MAKDTIFGHVVSHDDSVGQGWYYLARQINQAEAKVFFDEAYNKGSAEFQDHMGYKYKIVHNNGEYDLVKV